MLIYHFGSKEGLLVEVVRAMEATQRRALAGLAEARADKELGWDFWQQISDPRLHSFSRLFFEIYGQALQHRSWAEPLLEGVVDDWIAPATKIVVARGVPEEDAPAEARLGIAVARGLLLDLLATGNRPAVDAAAALFFARYAGVSTEHRTGGETRGPRGSH